MKRGKIRVPEGHRAMVMNRKSKAHEHGEVFREELEFRAGARRNKLLGQWAAEKMDLTGDAAVAYPGEVVESDFEEPGEDDVVRKVMKDFESAGVEITEERLRQEMVALLDVAMKQIEAEKT